MSRTLLCVHPHPDDEAIACGGVLARYGREGVTTHVVTCTGGEAGENLAGIDLGDRDLVAHRRREMADAVRVLGLDGHTWLGFRDSGMVGTEDNEHPDAFAAVDLYLAAARLARLIRRLQPQVVVSDDEHGTYGHPDHVRAHRVTQRAVVMAADPWWDTGQDPWQVEKVYVHVLSRSRMWRMHEVLTEAGVASPWGEEALAGPEDLPFGAADDAVTARIDVGDWLEVKREAMMQHRSQIGMDSFFFNLPDEHTRAAFGVEEFSLLTGTAAPGVDGVEDDLFAGIA